MAVADIGYTIDSIDSTIIEIYQGKPVSVKTGSHETLVIHLLRAEKSSEATVLANIEKDTNGFISLNDQTAPGGSDPFPNDGWYAKVTPAPK